MVPVTIEELEFTRLCKEAGTNIELKEELIKVWADLEKLQYRNVKLQKSMDMSNADNQKEQLQNKLDALHKQQNSELKSLMNNQEVASEKMLFDVKEKARVDIADFQNMVSVILRRKQKNGREGKRTNRGQ